METFRAIYYSVREEAPEWPVWENPRYEQLRIQWPDYQAGPAPEERASR